MNDLLALRLPGGYDLYSPVGVPTGGINTTGTGALTAMVNLLFIIASTLAIVYLVLGGIRWIMSSGDPKGIEAARRQILYAIIGLVIVALAFFAVYTIGRFFRTPLFG